MAESPSFAASFDDPRVTSQFCRRLRSDGADLTLLGVVHDHPASVARVETVVEAVDPDIVALELPSAAVELYRAYARETPPRFGGEMSAAIGAAPDADHVGIDAPSWSFLRRLLARLLADRVSPSTARRALSSLGGATRTAMACRVAATLTHAMSMTVAFDDPVGYDVDRDDPPERQAAHERAHVGGVEALLAGTASDALDYRDETRERCMVERVESLRPADEVVAVVGVDHLDALETALSDEDRRLTPEASTRSSSSR